MAVDHRALPFPEAITFFRQKVDLPTERWTDLWEGMHARAFVVAGAMQEDLLADLRQAVDGAIADGTTLEQFRDDFEATVARRGWTGWTGEGSKKGRAWRTRTIYETNLRTAYAAGRYRQMTDPAFLERNPYWEYRHGDSVRPRPLHLAWDGLVLKADDPWWKTHGTPNGWGCRCRTFARSERQLKNSGKQGPDTAPDDGTYRWKDRQTGRTHTIPNGIDPGWAYNVGEAAWGRPLSERAMGAWQHQGAAAWEPLTPGSRQSHHRPERIPLDKPKAKAIRPAATQTETAARLREQLGGEERTFTLEAKGWSYTTLVNAETLAAHLPLDRTPYLPFLEETLTDPYEVWQTFERHKGTGKVVLRQRFIKLLDLDKTRGMLLVAQATRGLLEAWTWIPTSKLNTAQNARRGLLLYGRE